MPIVSVNIPVYNDEKYIGETLLSALNQTYRDLEIVVVDDGSTDRTAEIIKSFSDSRIKYYYQTNQGIGATRNKAIEHSSGKYIAFLDHDDLWMPICTQFMPNENLPVEWLFANCFVIIACHVRPWLLNDRFWMKWVISLLT